MTPRDAARSPAHFAIYASRGRWWPAPWLRRLNEVLLRVATGEIRRLIVEAPPRHGKSEMISRFFPAWYMGRFPHRRIILASYGAELADSWSSKARDLLVAHGREVFGVRLGREARNSWTTLAGGEMNSAGVGGATTGKGADTFVIDDPVKNAEEALSARYKARAFDWYQTVANTRLEPTGSVVLLNTRWAFDDLTGRVTEAFRHQNWTRITLPALARENDPLGRAPGEALFPERFSREQLLSIQRGMTPAWWEALYGQRPTSGENSMFSTSEVQFFEHEGDGFRVDGVHIPRSDCEVFIVADLNVREKEANDPFVAMTCASFDHPVRGRCLIILDVVRLHINTTQHAPTLLRLHRQWNADWIGIEAVAYQASLANDLSSRGLPVRELSTEGKDKRVRAIPASIHLRRGRIFLLRAAPWVAPLLEEVEQFPKGAHDDQVDTLAYAGRELPMDDGQNNEGADRADAYLEDLDERYMV